MGSAAAPCDQGTEAAVCVGVHCNTILSSNTTMDRSELEIECQHALSFRKQQHSSGSKDHLAPLGCQQTWSHMLPSNVLS